ncbi:MAG: hypothetical protein DRH79_05960 [Candidatus Cloacimonadota bacterium]|nr:MAG: hypothetical protein DRH79_05960 [Candidatus Cloacimonadota bacterium]
MFRFFLLFILLNLIFELHALLPVNYLIVANEEIEDYTTFNEFIEWKTTKGYQITTNFVEISATVEEIDTWVEDQYNTIDPAPEFLLILGDVDGLYPVPSQIDGFPAGPSEMVSDLVYGVIGDVTNTNRVPQIQVGRLPFQTLDEFDIMIEKTLWYERDQFISNADISYLENVLGESNNNDNYWDWRNSLVEYGMGNYFNDTAANPYTGNTNNINGIAYYYPHADTTALMQNIIDDITEGVGFYYYIGNADKFQLKFPFFTIDHLNQLQNFQKYPIVYIGG